MKLTNILVYESKENSQLKPKGFFLGIKRDGNFESFFVSDENKEKIDSLTYSLKKKNPIKLKFRLDNAQREEAVNLSFSLDIIAKKLHSNKYCAEKKLKMRKKYHVRAEKLKSFLKA